MTNSEAYIIRSMSSKLKDKRLVLLNKIATVEQKQEALDEIERITNVLSEMANITINPKPFR